MKKVYKTRYFILFILIVGLVVFANPVFSQSEEETTSGSSAEDLRQEIENRNTLLQEILEEREEIEKNLDETGKQKNSLVKEIRTIDYNINRLNLSIKANKLILEKLDLEIESLRGDVRSIENNIQNKKSTVAKLMVELQQRDRENILTIFLKNKSLADSVSEAQSIITLNNDLTVSAGELRNFQYELIQKLNEEQGKQKSKKIEGSNLINRQFIVKDQKDYKNQVLTQTKNQEKIYEEQITELDEKQEEISRIMEEFEDQLRAAFDPSLLPLKRPGVIGFPVEEPLITQYYGPTKFAQRAYLTKTHTGVDFRAPLSTPILAAFDGRVVAEDNNDKSRWRRYQYGKYIVIEHENNLSTLYAHLSRVVVKEGDILQRGDLIGYSGNTGYSTAAHLHFGLYWAPSIQYKKIAPAAGLVPVGVTIDPMDYLPNIK